MTIARHIRWPTRLWLIARVGLTVLLAAWLGRYAYLRLTVMPPRSAENLFAGLSEPWTPGPDDVTDEVAAIVFSLTKDVPFQSPAPPKGMAWDWSSSYQPKTLSVGDVIYGEWTPPTRPHLQAVVAHLGSPGIREQIENLHRLRGRPWHFDTWAWLAAYDGEALYAQVRYAVRTLVADARYQHAQRGDVDAAWEDLKTGMWLVESTPANALIAVLVRDNGAISCLGELRRAALECEISADLAADMDRALRAMSPVSELWPGAMAGERSLCRAGIDAGFTRDEHGDGWYVSSATAAVFDPYVWRDGSSGVRCWRLWNLASAFYNNRATVEAKVEHFFGNIAGIAALPYSKALAALDPSVNGSSRFNLLDGGELRALSRVNWTYTYQHLIRTEAERRATRLMIALNRFKADMGLYPVALAELVPEYIDALPSDPYGALTFGYRRDRPEAYVLYSLGPDGKSDGGEAGPVKDRPFPSCDENGDDIYTFPRHKPYFEPEPVPATDSTDAADEAADKDGEP